MYFYPNNAKIQTTGRFVYLNNNDAVDCARQSCLIFETGTDEIITILKAQGLTERTVEGGVLRMETNIYECCFVLQVFLCRHLPAEKRYQRELLWTDGVILIT